MAGRDAAALPLHLAPRMGTEHAGQRLLRAVRSGVAKMVDRSRGRSSGGGLFTTVSLGVLVLAVVLVGVAAALLANTLIVAQSISGKAATIASTGRGINTATDSIVQLQRTNQSAASILESAKPLQGLLTTIVNTAGEINNQAGSINGSAGSINGSATGINGSAGSIIGSATAINTNAGNILGSATRIDPLARDINTEAASILGTARLVDRDAKDINDALDRTISIARDIKRDSSDILDEARDARQTSSCIAEKLLAGPPASSGDCRKGA